MEKNDSPAMGLCRPGDVVCDKEDTVIHLERINHSVNSVETIGESAKAKI